MTTHTKKKTKQGKEHISSEILPFSLYCIIFNVMCPSSSFIFFGDFGSGRNERLLYTEKYPPINICGNRKIFNFFLFRVFQFFFFFVELKQNPFTFYHIKKKNLLLRFFFLCVSIFIYVLIYKIRK